MLIKVTYSRRQYIHQKSPQKFMDMGRENNSHQCTFLLRVDYKFALRWVQIHDMAYLKVIAVDFKKKELQGIRLERVTRPPYEIKFQSDVEKFLSPSLK